MTFEIYSSTTNRWVDITPYVKYEGFEGSRNDVDGPNAGRAIEDALMVRDRLATKLKFNITTIPITLETARMIEELLMPEFFNIRTDYYSVSLTTYEVYSNNVVKAYLINHATEGELVKLSFPIVER